MCTKLGYTGFQKLSYKFSVTLVRHNGRYDAHKGKNGGDFRQLVVLYDQLLADTVLTRGKVGRDTPVNGDFFYLFFVFFYEFLVKLELKSDKVGMSHLHLTILYYCFIDF